ncbi:MAG: hypothetical protein J6R59_05635 [Paludibacteraceae bacterium]|nr:hypothetical protein [Paludibacteraceae bacterium]MBO5827930.1 hypothetical protein [Paludibacteraceae bacterium]
MKQNLNASAFTGLSAFNQQELFSVLECCVDIYGYFIACGNKVCNKEEQIRNIFFEKLNDDDYRSKHPCLQNFHFEKEPQENSGFLDIKVKTLNPYESTKAYYIIECKRLGSKNLLGENGLNAEYIKNGICRYVTGYYSTYFSCNVMFGFVVESVSVQTDIIDNINSMINNNYINAQHVEVNANAIQKLTHKDFVNGYSYSYISKHSHISGKEIVLYHIMFDFSQNIR